MVVLTYTILMVGLLCIAFGLFQFVKTEQQVSHFHSIAITEGSTAGTLNTAALLQGQYKTVGKGFIVGQRITISALMYLRELETYRQLKEMMSQGASFVAIENSESPDSYRLDITKALESGDINQSFVNNGFLTVDNFSDKTQTFLMHGDVVFTKEGQLTFGMPLKPILNSYRMKIEGIPISPSYVHDQIQANRWMAFLTFVSIGIALISLFIALRA